MRALYAKPHVRHQGAFKRLLLEKLMLLLLVTKREAILRTESTHKEKQNPETHREKGGVLNGLYCTVLLDFSNT